MNIGDTLELTPEKWVDNGYTIAHYLNKTFFLRAGIPQQKGNFTIEKITSKLVFASNYSVHADCKAFAICGGCSFRHIPYEKELELKLSELSRAIQINADSIEIIKDSPLGYRNNVQWKINKDTIGFFKSFSNEIVDLKSVGCLNLDSKLKFPSKNNHNSKNTDIKLRLSSSTSSIDYTKEDTILNLGEDTFTFPKNAFMQTNQYLLKPWLEKIKGLLPTNDSKIQVLELYCGSGIIGLYARDKINKLNGFDMVNSSIQYAQKNATALKAKNFRYKAIDLSVNFPNISKGKFNFWIMNPARSGLSEIVRKAILNYIPDDIIYSSCDALTMARDIKYFKQAKVHYSFERIMLFDFFPRTPHYEVLIHLKKK